MIIASLLKSSLILFFTRSRPLNVRKVHRVASEARLNRKAPPAEFQILNDPGSPDRPSDPQH
jgi:hypothetical protein